MNSVNYKCILVSSANNEPAFRFFFVDIYHIQKFPIPFRLLFLFLFNFVGVMLLLFSSSLCSHLNLLLHLLFGTYATTWLTLYCKRKIYCCCNKHQINELDWLKSEALYEYYAQCTATPTMLVDLAGENDGIITKFTT